MSDLPTKIVGRIRIEEPAPTVSESFDSDYIPPGEPVSAQLAPQGRRKFYLEPFEDIRFTGGEEWLVKRVLPRRGVAALYGKSGSFKTFIGFDLGCCIAAGKEWAGLKVTQAPVVYIAAEGAAGVRKRKEGWTQTNPDISEPFPFHLISDAPNLGAAQGDLADLITSIEDAGVAPGVIFIDTLAQTLGGADENGAGMVQYIANAQALSKRFDCLVVIVHHVGLADDQRLRGHSSLHGALDAQALCERQKGALATDIKIQKLKDEDADRTFSAILSRVVIGHDEDGDEVSTLIVESVTQANGPKAIKPKEKAVPRGLRLLMDVIAIVADEKGINLQSFADGPFVRAANEKAIRLEYNRRHAETAEPGEDPDKLADRQRKAFQRHIEKALNEKLIAAGEHRGERVIWTI